MSRPDDWVYQSGKVGRSVDSLEVRESVAIAGLAHGIERCRQNLDDLSSRLDDLRQLWVAREEER